MAAPLLDLAVLQTLAALHQEGTLARAAERVGRTPSALSLQLLRLQEQLGTTLFDRSGRSLAFNESGLALLAYAQRLLALNAEAVAHVRGHAVSGAVRLGISVDFEHTWLPRAMARFHRAHPRIALSLVVDRNSALERAVDRGELDLALVFGAEVAGARGRLGRLPMAWIGAPGYAIEAGAQVPLLLLEHPCLFRAAALEALEAAALPWRIAVSSPSLGGIWATAAAGLGVTARCAAAIPPGLVEVGRSLGLPALPFVSLRILEASGRAAAPRSTLRAVLRETAEELLAGAAARP